MIILISESPKGLNTPGANTNSTSLLLKVAVVRRLLAPLPMHVIRLGTRARSPIFLATVNSYLVPLMLLVAISRSTDRKLISWSLLGILKI